MTEQRLDKPVVVLERIEPGVTPDYCCHGRTPSAVRTLQGSNRRRRRR